VADRETNEYPNSIRQTAWYIATANSPGCWPFWRHGFISRWGKLRDRHDLDAIPNYDGIAQQVASQFPEFATNDGTERLFDFLFQPYKKYLTAEEIYQKALHLAPRLKGESVKIESSEIEF
jgi:hypothetical protein